VNRLSLGLLLVACTACSDGSNNPVKKDGGPVDTLPVDSGPCPANQFFTGQYVDWDWTDTAACGIFGATFTVHGNSSLTDSTAPNGRFQLCLPSAAKTQVDITAPTAQSECTMPKSGYTMSGLTIADPAVLDAGQLLDYRNFTTNRQATLGVALDAAKAQVFVHVALTPQPVSISNASAATQYFDGTQWTTTGPLGVDVFFVNVDVGTGTTNVTMTGGAIGAGSIPLVANKITYVTLVGM
jgi:hypothetical protein